MGDIGVVIDLRQIFVVSIDVFPFKGDEDDFFDCICRIPLQKLTYRTEGNWSGLAAGISVHSGADGGEGDSLASILDSQPQALAVASIEEALAQIRLQRVVDRANGVDDFLARQSVGVGDLGRTRVAAPQALAFFQEERASGIMDGPVDSTAAEKIFVCGVDDGVDGKSGDVASE